MFRKSLEKDLGAIFEKERVSFSNDLAHFESELGTLFVVIDQNGVKNNFRDSESYFKVTGTLEFIDDKDSTDFGFFSQRMILSKYQAAGKLYLVDRESSESLNKEDSDVILVKKSQKFLYLISIPCNEPIGEIEGLTFQQT